ncbi:hypothetical protein ACNKHW_27315 [Shigella flexneri]
MSRKAARLSAVTLPKKAWDLSCRMTAACFDILIPKESINGARMGFVVGRTDSPSDSRTKALGDIPKCWARKWAPALLWILPCANMNSVYLADRCERQVADIREEVPEAAKQAVLIYATCRW